MKSRIAEQKVARSRVAFKSVDEVDREISRLDKQVESGTMKIVDEKKALAEISSLKKQRKGFTGFEEAQKGIDDTKAKLKELRDTLDDPAAKALGEKYNTIQVELDAIKAEQDEAYKSINTLRDQRTKLHAEQQEKYAAIRKIQDDLYHGKKAFQLYEYEARQRARERHKADQAAFDKEKRKERAQKVLAEASDPAYLDEIRRAEALLRFLDPTYVSTTSSLQAPSKFGAQPQRTVDESAPTGMKVLSKKDKEEDYFAGTGGKKGKKGRKTAESPAPGKFSCPPSVMEDCSAMGLDPPMSASDVPSVTEKVKAKLDHWKADQKVQTEKVRPPLLPSLSTSITIPSTSHPSATQYSGITNLSELQNIAKAQKEIERIEAEESGSATPTTNGSAKNASDKTITETVTDAASSLVETVAVEAEALKNAAADVVADLKATTLDEKKE